MFSGPQQTPFVCKTNQTQPPLNDSLGEPIVDNQAGDGVRVLNPDGTTAGWSRDCSARTVVDFLYRTPAARGRRCPRGRGPADMATTTMLDGRTVDFVVRRERGTIDRFLYSYAMLAPLGAADTEPRCGRRLVYAFDGGVAIGHSQGKLGSSSVDPDISARATRSSIKRHGHEHPLQPPARRRGRAHDQGALRRTLRRPALHRGRRRLRRRDPAVRLRPEPPAPARRRHRGQVLSRHDHADHPRRRLRAARVLHGRHRRGQPEVARLEQPRVADRAERQPGVPESLYRPAGQRRVRQRLAQPHAARAEPAVRQPPGAGSERMDPAAMAAIRWTHWEDARNVYGVAPDGWARNRGTTPACSTGCRR